MGQIFRDTKFIGSDDDSASPTWSGETVWDDASSDMDNAGKGEVWAATYPFGSGVRSGNGFLVCATVPDGVDNLKYRVISAVPEWNGTVFSNTTVAVIKDNAGSNAGHRVSCVVDSGDFAHVVHDVSGSTVVESRKGQTAGEDDWATAISVVSKQPDALSLTIDISATPDDLYVLYADSATSVDILYKISPVDTIVWGTEQTITLAQNVTALSTAQQDQASGIHIAGQYGTTVFYHTIALVGADFPLNAEPGSYAVAGAEMTFGLEMAALVGTYAVTGAPATFVQGSALSLDAGAYALTGLAATVLADRLLPGGAIAGSYAVTGLDAFFDLGMNALPGVYAVTGLPATILADRLLPGGALAGAYAVTGLDAFFDLGMNAVAGAYSISGLDAFFDLGMNAVAGAYAITGANASLLFGALLIADAGVYVVTGLPATFIQGFALALDPGTYSITGVDATLLKDSILSADPGAYVVSGAAASLLFGALLVADPGSYLVTGLPATFLQGSALSLDAGSYAVTGLAATALVAALLPAGATAGVYVVSGLDAFFDLSLNAVPGAYATTGLDAFFDIGMNALTGVYAVTGALATVLADRLLPGGAVAGSYVVTGAPATLLRGFILVADPGAYAVTGLSATILADRLLPGGALAGVYVVTGLDAELIFTPTGQVIIRIIMGEP